MKVDRSLYQTVEKTAFQVCAHVVSRLLRRDINSELARLKQLPKTRSYPEVACVVAVLFALALTSASLGFWGLFLYFAIVLVVFR